MMHPTTSRSRARAALLAFGRPFRLVRLALVAGLALGAAACGDVVSPRGVTTPTTSEVTTIPLTLASIAVGGAHSCGLTAVGEPYCWGRNNFGQLGDGTQLDRGEPTRVGGASGPTFVAIAAGYAHSCGITGAGEMYCWGRNGSGQLGDSTFISRSEPTRVPNLVATGMTLGDAHTCAWSAAQGASVGAVSCWGDNSFGQLGDGTESLRVVPTALVAGTPDARIVSAGGAHTCAFLGADAASTSLRCWGSNDFRQIDGTRTWYRTQPTALDPVPDVVSVTTGSWHSCGLNATGVATCWGYNTGGQLGFASGAASGPGTVGGGHVFASLDAGDRATCGRTADGETWCWGANDEGQLGDSTQTGSVAPVRVRGPAMSAIAVGDAHACGLTPTNEVWCWGANAYGQVGDGTQERRLVPVRVMLTVELTS